MWENLGSYEVHSWCLGVETIAVGHDWFTSRETQLGGVEEVGPVKTFTDLTGALARPPGIAARNPGFSGTTLLDRD